jgi:ABC-type bacteriocin/lantibiotic exporter with double-glycine peptidase domain
MASTPPFVGQEGPDACAVACLRMLLAHQGTDVSEAELIRRTTLDEGGLTPEELAVLARACGLKAKEQTLDDAELSKLVRDGRFPIVYLYRKYLDGADHVHAVIPVAFSKHFVTLLDPLRGKRRVSLRKFAKARSMVQNWAVVVEPG